MKKISLYLFVTLIAASFGSCKNDTVSVNDPVLTGDYFRWTLEDSITYGTYDISVVDSNNTFVAGYPCYKINNGIKTFINFSDSLFFAKIVRSYSKDYAVFAGARASFPDPTERQIKIYNNGIITSYPAPSSIDYEFGDVLIIEPGKFLVTGSPSSRFYLFNNGVFNEYFLPDTSGAYKFGMTNNLIYIFALRGIQGSIYKFENNQPVFIRNEPMGGAFYNLNSDIIRVFSPDFSQFFYDYFTETSWVRMNPVDHFYVRAVTGESRNFFMGLSQNSEYNYRLKVWNGTAYTQEETFPSFINSTSETNPIVSNYKDKTVYFYFNFLGPKLYKGKRIR